MGRAIYTPNQEDKKAHLLASGGSSFLHAQDMSLHSAVAVLLLAQVGDLDTKAEASRKDQGWNSWRALGGH